jgi:hypothetical protein
VALVSARTSLERDAIWGDSPYEEIADWRAPTLKVASTVLRAPHDHVLLSCPGQPCS